MAFAIVAVALVGAWQSTPFERIALSGGDAAVTSEGELFTTGAPHRARVTPNTKSNRPDGHGPLLAILGSVVAVALLVLARRARLGGVADVRPTLALARCAAPRAPPQLLHSR